MSTAYLGLGGNLGDRVQNLREALRRLAAAPGLLIGATSSVYETKPVGVAGQPDFLNMVVRVETTLAPRELLSLCLRIETELGRVRRDHWGPRTIDLDVLWYDGRTWCDSELVLPHPRLKERAFVLVPLAEIAPRIALDGESIERLIARVGEQGLQRLGAIDSLPA